MSSGSATGPGPTGSPGPQPRRIRDNPGQRGLRLRAGAAPGLGVGLNYFGQLGNGSAATDSATPVIVDRRTQNATQIVAGWNHAFATHPDGSLWA